MLPHFGQKIFLRAEATSGDPAAGCPWGCRSSARRWSEPALIALAYSFEQASQALSWPSLQATLPGYHPAGSAGSQR